MSLAKSVYTETLDGLFSFCSTFRCNYTELKVHNISIVQSLHWSIFGTLAVDDIAARVISWLKAMAILTHRASGHWHEPRWQEE